MNVDEFRETVLAASASGGLVLEYRNQPRDTRMRKRKVTLEVCHYGGARIDRLMCRNSITKQFGFDGSAGGTRFWSVEEGNGCGTFLADVLVNYGKDYWFRIDGKRVPLVSDLESSKNPNAYMHLGPIKAIPRRRLGAGSSKGVDMPRPPIKCTSCGGDGFLHIGESINGGPYREIIDKDEPCWTCGGDGLIYDGAVNIDGDSLYDLILSK